MSPWCFILMPLIVVSAFNPETDEIVVNQGVVSWEKPGCHRIGFTRWVSIPNCVRFQLTTNACRGYCESWSLPSTWQSLVRNPAKPLTVFSQCCNIIETEFVSVRVMCVNGPKDYSFKSAKSCACFHCKHA